MGSGCRESCVSETLVCGGGYCQRSIAAVHGEDAENLRRIHESECGGGGECVLRNTDNGSERESE
ncbi:glycosyltransferase [Sesbania bispinosa]|nr:glycosyltransferase [Sesbania bispinosa]